MQHVRAVRLECWVCGLEACQPGILCGFQLLQLCSRGSRQALLLLMLYQCNCQLKSYTDARKHKKHEQFAAISSRQASAQSQLHTSTTTQNSHNAALSSPVQHGAAHQHILSQIKEPPAACALPHGSSSSLHLFTDGWCLHAQQQPLNCCQAPDVPGAGAPQQQPWQHSCRACVAESNCVLVVHHKACAADAQHHTHPVCLPTHAHDSHTHPTSTHKKRRLLVRAQCRVVCVRWQSRQRSAT